MRVIPALAALGLLAACVPNPYVSTYSSQLSDKVPRAEPRGLAPSGAEPRLLSTRDYRADAIKLLEAGYQPIGHSRFTSTLVRASAALEQARAVGADLVLVKVEHVGSSTYAQPVQEWVPDQRIVTEETLQQRGAGQDSVQTQTRQSVTTIEGEYQTRYVPQTVETYDHLAGYWRKAPKPLLGLLVAEMDDSLRKSVGSNKGVLVKVVVRASPAFNADLFRGDVLRSLAGHELLGVDDFFEQVLAHAGQSVELLLWRDGKTLRKTVTLAQP